MKPNRVLSVEMKFVEDRSTHKVLNLKGELGYLDHCFYLIDDDADDLVRRLVINMMLIPHLLVDIRLDIGPPDLIRVPPLSKEHPSLSFRLTKILGDHLV